MPSADHPSVPPVPSFADLAAELHAGVHAGSGASLTADVIVRRMLELLAEAECASITVATRRDGHRTLASTDDRAAAADALQYELGEGPCVEASTHAAWLRSGDVGTDTRWPRWGPAARTLGVGSVLSVQLSRNERLQGALNVYSRRAGRFAERDVVDVALVFAAHAANALSSARLVSDLQTALSSRHQIGMAQGILMERYGLDEHRSFELLRRLSSTGQGKLRDLARQIVETGALPDGGARRRGTHPRES